VVQTAVVRIGRETVEVGMVTVVWVEWLELEVYG